jgi:bifunctional DNA-binding transcriptional regulator/antitoxin component of YhaV-PrlF toxin-antitoxin module
MQQIINITSQWQIYVPEIIRKQMNLDKPTRATIFAKDGLIYIKPIKSKILSLAGKFRGRKPVIDIIINKERDYIDYSDL